MITAILSGISIASIIIVTTVLMIKQNELSDDYNNKIKRVVSQVNEVNASGYNVIQNQEDEVTKNFAAVNKNIADVRAKYVTSEKLNHNLSTTSANIGSDYEIKKDSKTNNLSITLPKDKNSGFQIVNGEQTKFAVDGKTGQVAMYGDISTLGNTKADGGIDISKKWRLGDTNGDDWLRLKAAGKNGQGDYYGGLAAGKLWVGNDAHLQGHTNVNGTLRTNGNISTPNGHTIHSDGRQHISGGEILYLLPKKGVQIGKEWGGTGDLNVQGNLSTGGNTNVNGKFTVSRGDGNWNWANIKGNHNDNLYVGSDGTNRGIWADGNRNFSIYNQGQTGLTVDPAGNAYAAANQIKFSTNWTGYPDKSKNSEIANDTNAFKELMVVGNKSAGGERRVGVWDTLNVHGTLNTDGALNANGRLRANGTISTPHGHTIHSDGRQHISGGEILYLLPKTGVQIGKEWGGTGNLNVQGNLSTQGSTQLNGPLIVNNGQSDGSKGGINLWRDGDSRFGMWMSDTAAHGGKSLTGGPVADGGISRHSVRFSTGNWDGHGFVFQNSDGKPLMSIKGNDGRTNVYGQLSVNPDGSDTGVNNGLNLWHPGDRRFGMFMSTPGKGKGLGGGDVPDGGISHHSVRFSTGNWGGHGFVFQNSDGRPLVSIKGDDGRTNVYGDLNTNGWVNIPNINTGINFRNNSSRIWENGHLQIQTDDVMNMSAPVALNINTPEVNVSGAVNVANKWRLGNTGDDWLRMNAPGKGNTNSYYGGLAAGKLWTAQGGLAGSDIRMKDNVVNIDKATSDNLLKLNPMAYTYKDDESKRQRFGFIAQDVEKVYPDMVRDGANGMKSLNYDDIIPLTVANIKDIRKNIPNSQTLCIDDVCLNKNDLINLKKMSR